MLVDAETNDILLNFMKITKYDRKGSYVYSAKQLTDIFNRSVEDVIRFYIEFVNTIEDLEQEIDIDSVKVYLRLFPSTGNWYIGSTTKKFADLRHLGDVSTAKNLQNTKSSLLFNFYKQYPDIPVMIFTITQVNNIRAALLIEKKLIYHFTNPNNNTPLPIDLCLNTQYKYCSPPKPKCTPRPMPKIVEIEDCLNEKGRMFLEQLLNMKCISTSPFEITFTEPMPKIVKIEDCLDEKGRMFLEQLLNMKRISTSPFEITFTEHKDDIDDTDW